MSVSPATSADGRAVLVGTVDAEVVGLGSIRLDRMSHAAVGEPAGVLELLYVVPAARRRGAARAVLACAAQWAADRGCARLDAVALPGDRALKSLFETAGLRARLLVLSSPIGPGSS